MLCRTIQRGGFTFLPAMNTAYWMQKALEIESARASKHVLCKFKNSCNTTLFNITLGIVHILSKLGLKQLSILFGQNPQ